MTRRIIKILVGLFLAGAFLLGIFIISIYLGAFGTLPTQSDLLHYKNKTASLVLADDGEIIGRFFAQNRTNITYAQLPGYLVDALISTEDARFFQHEGIDSRSLLRVIFKSILFSDPDAGGGSTISQQLVKNMFGRQDYGFLSLPVNKIREALIAHRLEKVYNKEEVLALYLNTVAFGEDLYGIEAAARRYFNKSTPELDIQESAVLVGMLKANTTYNPHRNPDQSKSRRNVVFSQMVKYGYLNPLVADSLDRLPLGVDYANIEASGPADYFLVHVQADTRRLLDSIFRSTGKAWNIEEDGLIIRTTLDARLQRFARESFRRHLPEMQTRLQKQYSGTSGLRQLHQVSDTLQPEDAILHAGLIALDPVSGAIRAWVGGVNFQLYPYDQVTARRQLASAFKPVIYAAAIENGYQPCRYLSNKPIELPEFDNWSPQNYDHSTGGMYSMAGALAHSMNIPTVNLFLSLGFDPVSEMWQKMGFTFALDNTPSVALGTGEASIYELAVAYASFANEGYRIHPVTIASISAPDGTLLYYNPFSGPEERIMSPETGLLMRAMLQKAVREGTGVSMHSVYGVNYPWAGKTGTSQNYADAWFGAFDPRLVMVTRVGASTPAIHFNHGSSGSGSALALPLVAMTLKKVETDSLLSTAYIEPYPELPEELAGKLDCPDTRSGKPLELIRELFGIEKNIKQAPVKTLAEPDSQPPPKKKWRLFDLFRKKKK
jgi:penicillin-binding protein 1A